MEGRLEYVGFFLGCGNVCLCGRLLMFGMCFGGWIWGGGGVGFKEGGGGCSLSLFCRLKYVVPPTFLILALDTVSSSLI